MTAHHGLESARKAMVVLPPHEGQKHQKWSKVVKKGVDSVFV
jgi:hypothetical protein